MQLPNVTPLVFSEEEGSFLSGMIAAHKSKTCHIGFVGGAESPLIKKFEAGYVAGAKAAAPNIKIDSDYLTPAGDYSGFQDPNMGSEASVLNLIYGATLLLVVVAAVHLWRRSYVAAGAALIGAGVMYAIYWYTDRLPEELTAYTPHLVTLVVLAAASQRLRPPAANGLQYRRGIE